jgi:hypothetical protein
MKKVILTAILATLVSLAFCQDITLKIGTAATYQLSKASGKKFTLTLIDTKTIDQPVEQDDLLKDKVDTNMIKVAFVKGKFGDRPAILLMLKTGRTGMIKYSAKIKYAGRSKFVNTDVNMIIGNVKTMEMWQNDISEIQLSDFEEGSY